MIYAELERLAREPLGPSELETAKTRLITHFMRELRPPAGKAEALGHYETTVGDYRQLFAVADGYRAVTAADVARVVAMYLTPQRRTVVIAMPTNHK
jgi:zinc protease